MAPFCCSREDQITKDPNAQTDFLPDRERDAALLKERELRKLAELEWEEKKKSEWIVAAVSTVL
jgi:hypothetical protein